MLRLLHRRVCEQWRRIRDHARLVHDMRALRKRYGLGEVVRVYGAVQVKTYGGYVAYIREIADGDYDDVVGTIYVLGKAYPIGWTNKGVCYTSVDLPNEVLRSLGYPSYMSAHQFDVKELQGKPIVDRLP